MSRRKNLDDDVFSKYSISDALRNWHKESELGKHPLSKLAIVQNNIRSPTRKITDRDIGRSLKQVLNNALDHLPEMFRTMLKKEYIDDELMTTVAEELHLPVRTYSRRKDVAFEKLASTLLEWEDQAISEKWGSSPFIVPRKDIPLLVGRSKLVNEVKDCLIKKAVPSVVFIGIPGVGKTALAVELAHDREIKQYFSDVVLWAGLGKEPNIDFHLGQWFSKLRIFPEEISQLGTTEERAERIRKEIGDQRFLLILDDVWQVETAQSILAARGHNCSYIITTRDQKIAQKFGGSTVQTVTELNISDGLELLSMLAPGVIDVEPDDAIELVRSVGGHPLALILIGHYLAEESYARQERRIREALDKLRKAQELINLAEPPSEPELFPSLPKGASISLNAIYSLSYEVLDEDSRSLLCDLIIFPPKPNTFSEEAATTIFKVLPNTLDKLLDCSLLESVGTNRYTLHQATYNFVITNQKGLENIERFVEYFILLVKERQEDHTSLALETQNILTALHLAFVNGMCQPVIDGVSSFYTFMEMRGMYDLAEKMIDYANECARKVNDKGAMARINVYRGRRMNKVGEYRHAIAYFEQCVAIAEEIGNSESLCNALEGMGVALATLGQYDDAEQKWLRAIEIARQNEFEKSMCDILRGLGTRAIIGTDYKVAEELLTEALRLSRKIGYHVRECTILSNLASLKTRQGQYDLAEQHLLECLQLAQDIGYEAYIVHVYSQLVGIALYKNDLGMAIQYIQKALPLANQIGSPEERARLNRNYGETIAKMGDYQQSCQYFSNALSIARDIDNQQLIGGVLAEWGEIHLKFHEYENAEKLFSELLVNTGINNDKELKGAAEYGLGRVAASRGDYLLARNLCNDALIIFGEFKDVRSEEVKQFLDLLADK